MLTRFKFKGIIYHQSLTVETYVTLSPLVHVQHFHQPFHTANLRPMARTSQLLGQVGIHVKLGLSESVEKCGKM